MIQLHQDIRFCTAADGVQLAYATTGSGLPLVKAANYLTHVQHDWNGPVWRHWLAELSRHHTFVRYDERGCGLSDRDVDDFSLEAWVRDLEAVVDAAELDRFDLLGISQGASVSIAYAVAHPDRVDHLVLYGGYARGRFHRGPDADQRLQAETMVNVIRSGWGDDNPAFRQLFSTMLMPDGSREQIDALNELARRAASAETAACMQAAFHDIDVRDQAPSVTTPTLVLHARDDAAIPFEEGRRLAGLVPGARFVPLEGRNHILLEHEPAWPEFLGEVRSFLADAGPPRRDPLSRAPDEPVFPELSPREVEVLALVGRGLSNDEIADHLYISSKTTRNHVSRIYTKLGIDRRAQAVVLSREAGLVSRT